MTLLSPIDRVKVGTRRVVRRVYRQPMNTLEDLGDQLSFYGRALAWTPRTLRRYKRETFRLLARRRATTQRARSGAVGGRGAGLAS